MGDAVEIMDRFMQGNALPQPQVGAVSGFVVHSSIQQAMRQDNRLWIIYAWLYQNPRIIAIPTPLMEDSSIQPGDLSVVLSKEGFRMSFFNIQYEPLNKTDRAGSS